MLGRGASPAPAHVKDLGAATWVPAPEAVGLAGGQLAALLLLIHSISQFPEACIFPRQLQQHLLHPCCFLLSFLALSPKNEV